MAEVIKDEFTENLKRTVKASLNHGTIAKGLHEVAKALEKKNAQFCVLAKNCTEENLVKLVKGLCKQSDIPLYIIDEAETLGDWLGISQYDKDKAIRKKRKCSTLVIKSFPDEIKEEERKVILSNIPKVK